MSDAVIVGLLTLAGVIVSAWFQNRAFSKDLEKAQAVTDTKLDELTREVRAHNGFAQRVPVLEEQIKVANHRIEDLERGRNG